LIRKSFLTGSAAAAGLGVRPVRASELTPLTMQLQWIKDAQYAGWWVADANGYFRDAGIALTIVAGGPNVSSIEALVQGGRADVGIDQLERVVDANAEGADLVVIGALYQTSPSGLLSLPRLPVRTARDILGKRLGLQQGGEVYIDAILRVNNLPLDYKQIVVGFDPEPLLQGACDAYLCFVVNQPFALAVHHIPYVVATFDQLGYASCVGTLFCRRDYLRANRAVLVRYLRALQRGWLADFQDPVRGAALAVQTYGASLGLEMNQQIAVNRAQAPLIQSAETRAHGLFWIDLNRIAGPVYASLRASGRTKLPPPSHYIDVSLLEEAKRAA
jgi:ABC-type nitrate/sulfonate/bicarbonate transport system substrate-binding protein